MGREKYMEILDAWLEERLKLVAAATVDTDKVIEHVKKELKEKILESFKNGASAGRYGKTYATRKTNTQGAAQGSNSTNDAATATKAS